MTGVVKSYSAKNGYGFVISDDVEYFFRYTDIQGKKYPCCTKGEKVSFFPVNGDKGLRATRVNSL